MTVPADATQTQIDQAYALERQAKGAIATIATSGWELARALYLFAEGDGQRAGWQLVGYDKLNDWLADPDVSLSRTQFYRMVRVWRDLTVIAKVPVERLARLDLTKVELVRRPILDGKSTEDALADVAALGWRDLREKYSPNPAPVTPGTAPPVGTIVDELSSHKPTAKKDDKPPEPVTAAQLAAKPGQILCEYCGSYYWPEDDGRAPSHEAAKKKPPAV